MRERLAHTIYHGAATAMASAPPLLLLNGWTMTQAQWGSLLLDGARTLRAQEGVWTRTVCEDEHNTSNNASVYLSM